MSFINTTNLNIPLSKNFMMIISDFDQTLRSGNSCIEILHPNKKTEGVMLHNKLILECNPLVQEHDDINELVEAIDQTH